MKISSSIGPLFAATAADAALHPSCDSIDRFLVFEVGGESFGIPFSRLAEVRTLQNALPVLNAPDYGSGVVALNGRPIAAIDLRVDFGQAARFDQDTRLVVVFHRRPGRDDELVGLLVDRVHDVITIDPAQIEPVPDFGPEADTGFILGMIACGTRNRLLLDVDRLIEN